jgi:hypothetical protein
MHFINHSLWFRLLGRGISLSKHSDVFFSYTNWRTHITFSRKGLTILKSELSINSSQHLDNLKIDYLGVFKLRLTTARDSPKLTGSDKRYFQGIAKITVWHENFLNF